ncbi:MAG: winged helix-turn-helix transcriptional regulator [Rhodospirillales bacterium]|nr:winged helix-turn-helix transcriptional regulator [Rhodospirillales bacterium]
MNTAIDDQQLSAVADMFHLLGDPTRLKIVYSCLDEMRSAGDIALHTGASASLVSHHLRLLKAARLVRSERRGRQVFYVAADHHIRHVLGDMVDHLNEPQANGKV